MAKEETQERIFTVEYDHGMFVRTAPSEDAEAVDIYAKGTGFTGTLLESGWIETSDKLYVKFIDGYVS